MNANPYRTLSTTCLCTLLCALFIGATLATPSVHAKIKPIQELTQLPENEREDNLWLIASNHENNVHNDGRMLHDANVERYLEGMADKMLGNAIDHVGVDIDFFIVKDPMLSAWVYPYGTIAIHTGLIAGVENEAQLAAIVAHELSHFLQRHSYRELVAERRQGVLGKGLGLLLTAAAASQTGVIDTNLMKAGGVWTDLVTSGYSRKNEHIADAEGLELMKRAGYERHEAVAAFTALKDNDIYGVVNVSQLWSSHPKLDDRIDNVGKAVAKEKKSKGYAPGTPADPRAYYTAVAPILLLNAKLDIAERQFGRARNALNKYLKVRNDDPEAHFLVGETYRLQAPAGPEFTDRTKAYEAALAQDSGYAQAYKELGLALRQAGDKTSATEAFENYLAREPDALDAGIIKWYLQSL